VGRDALGGGEGSVDAREQIDDHVRRDAELTIGEMLDENRAQKRVVWGANLDNGGRTQART
jgi:hypothetical protein